MKLVQVLVVDVGRLELTNLGGLYVANLLSLVLDFLAHFSTLFEIVEAILFLASIVI